jgi:hypothetical protein
MPYAPQGVKGLHGEDRIQWQAALNTTYIYIRVPSEAQNSLYDHFIFIQRHSPWSEFSQKLNFSSLYLKLPSDIPPVNPCDEICHEVSYFIQRCCFNVTRHVTSQELTREWLIWPCHLAWTIIQTSAWRNRANHCKIVLRKHCPWAEVGFQCLSSKQQ